MSRILTLAALASSLLGVAMMASPSHASIAANAMAPNAIATNAMAPNAIATNGMAPNGVGAAAVIVGFEFPKP